jgi:hypothetical protein
MFTSAIIGILFVCRQAVAVGGGDLTTGSHAYTAGYDTSKVFEGAVSKALVTGSYEYTGYGSAESSIEIANDGTLIYSPAFSNGKTGYVTSKDHGKNWNLVIPSPNQSRAQPVFNIHNGRYFYWSTGIPGIQMSYSDDQGANWKKISDHLQPQNTDWVHMASGKPVMSELKNTSSVMYISGPSTVSVYIAPGIGPVKQLIAKSVDGGLNWKNTGSAPTLSATQSGGACASLSPAVQKGEYIIWSNGLVRPNGTVIFSLRRCQSLSIAISDDEGDTWRFSDVPGSKLVPYSKGLGT